MRPRHCLIAGLGLAMLATQAPAATTRAERARAELDKELAGRIPGKPLDCLLLSNITGSYIVPGTGIVYRGIGSTLYVNRTLDGDARALDDDDILVTTTYGSQLCRMDNVKLLDRTSRFIHGFVSLGAFEPYAKPPKVKKQPS